VTREASLAEDNAQVSPDASAQRWREANLRCIGRRRSCYALPRAIDADIRAGRTVVVNASRTGDRATAPSLCDIVVV